MDRIVLIALAAVGLSAAGQAPSWSVVHELAGVQGVASVQWRLWQSDQTPPQLHEEVTVEVSGPVCIGMIMRPLARIDTASSIGGFIVPMSPRNGRLVIGRLRYAAGEAFRGQAQMELVQAPQNADGTCPARNGLRPAAVDAMAMLPTLSDAEIRALIRRNS